MQVFLTGASGFVGSAIAKDLLANGHEVLGLARSGESAEKLEKAGIEVLLGDILDPESLKTGSDNAEAVIHTAFNHDFSRFAQSCEEDRKVILAFGEALRGSKKPLVVTSGIGLLNYGRLVNEDDLSPGSEIIPRAATEEAARAVSEMGVNAYIVRLPPTVHGPGDHGFVPLLINLSKEKKISAYIGDGANKWPAVHCKDAASLYRLIVEKKPAQKVFHAVGEQGIEFRLIAESIGKRLNLPVLPKTGSEALNHFDWFLHFASMDCPASSEKSRVAVGWEPKHPDLFSDLHSGIYINH